MDELNAIRTIFTESLPTFYALGDPTRQKLMLLMLDPHPKSVQELAAGTKLSRPTISHHLKILKDAGLVSEQKQGTRHYYHPNAGTHVQQMKVLLEEIKRLEQKKEREE